MNAWPDEFRLIAVIATNALMLAACWRVARRSTARAVVALPDAILYWLAAQYVTVGVCGMLGVMWPTVTLAIGCLASIALLYTCKAATALPLARREDRITWAAFAFVVAYAGAIIVHQHFIPELATDPLVYHVPAAAHWVQDGRISLVDFWYWLPANTYSPLAGSVWIAWWLGPMGNDVLSRYVQLPTWLLLFAACVRLLRDLRVPTAVAAIVAVALVVSRPFASQLTIAKDDIAVAALALTVLGGLHARRLREPGAPFRLGIAFGLLISVKYPAILAMAVALPAIVTLRWWRSLGIRGVGIAGAISIAFVAPWLIRNAIVTGGNPFYPFFAGGGGFIPDPTLRSAAGVWHMLAGSFFAPPPTVWALIGLGALAVLSVARRRLLAHDGVAASLLIGPPLAIALLVVTFPWPEVRYLFAAIAAAVALVGLAIARISDRRLAVAVAIAFLGVTFGTSFNSQNLIGAAEFVVAGGVAAAIVLAGLSPRVRIPPRMRAGAAIACGLPLLIGIYVYWSAFVSVTYPLDTNNGWRFNNGDLGESWATLRENLPAGSTVAYVNTPTTWPLFGFDLQMHVVYAPVRPGITHLNDLPPIREPIRAADEYIAATRQLNEQADWPTWLANLERLKVDALFVAKADASNDPPELRFIAEHPERFQRVSENDAALIVRFRR